MKPKISIIKERNENELRVILTPTEVAALVSEGYCVYAEHNCGIHCGYDDDLYVECGAQIVNQCEAWKYADLVLKYKAPLPSEYRFFSDRTTIMALFHAEGDKGLLEAMVAANVTAYSFEFFETEEGFFPLSFPGGEIAGKSAILWASHYLQNHLGGKGKILCDISGVPRPRIGILGYGSVGSSAISIAISLGCDVIVFGRNMEKLRKLQINYGSRIEIHESTEANLNRIIPTLDVLVGAILISTYDTEPVVTTEMIQKMEDGSVIIDVTCGYGEGYLPFIKGYTSFENPVQRIDKLNCIKIDKLPAAYHKTTTAAYSANLLPYLKRYLNALSSGEVDTISQRGCIVKNGTIVHQEIKKHWDYYHND